MSPCRSLPLARCRTKGDAMNQALNESQKSTPGRKLTARLLVDSWGDKREQTNIGDASARQR